MKLLDPDGIEHTCRIVKDNEIKVVILGWTTTEIKQREFEQRGLIVLQSTPNEMCLLHEWLSQAPPY